MIISGGINLWSVIAIQSRLTLYIGGVRIEGDWKNILLEGIVLNILAAIFILFMIRNESVSIGFGFFTEFLGGLLVVIAGILLKLGKPA